MTTSTQGNEILDHGLATVGSRLDLVGAQVTPTAAHHAAVDRFALALAPASWLAHGIDAKVAAEVYDLAQAFADEAERRRKK